MHGLFMRDSSGAAALEPGPGLRRVLLFFLCLRFVVHCALAQRNAYGIDDGFQ